MPSLHTVVEAIRSLPSTRAAPRVAVVCLQYGARHAAEELLAAGVQSVLWATADVLAENLCSDLFCKAIAPSVLLLEDGRLLEDDEELLELEDENGRLPRRLEGGGPSGIGFPMPSP